MRSRRVVPVILLAMSLLAMGAPAGAASALPVRVAVLPVRTEVYVWGWNAAASVTPMLETVLLSSGRAVLVERWRLDAVLQEQVWERMGLTGGDATRLAGVLGADLLVLGTVIEARVEPVSSLWTPAGEVQSWQAVVALTMRVVAAADGWVLLVRTERGDARALVVRGQMGDVVIAGGQPPTATLLDRAARAAIDSLGPHLLRVLSEHE